MSKKIKFKKTISEITIVNNKKLAPYIELANFSSTNIDQEKLGTILGVFEIKETSEDSAYIVNFLSSVIKKTYFSSSKKTAEESFEATLERLNLTLSEIANHGNINWIGKIDAVLFSVTENNINFTVSGDAKVLLLRNKKLLEISQGLSPKDEAVNPLKTFTDISSGQLKESDRIILTTGDIFHILDMSEIEKYANDLTADKFIRFLKTVLVNKLNIAGAMIIDIERKTVSLKPSATRENSKKITNAFGAKAFKEVAKKQKTVTKQSQQQEALAKKDTPKEYTNEKTGHIHITDSTKDIEQYTGHRLENLTTNIKDGCSNFYCKFKSIYLKKLKYRFNKTCRPAIKKFFLLLISTLQNSSRQIIKLIVLTATSTGRKISSIAKKTKQIPRPNITKPYKHIATTFVKAKQEKVLKRPSFLQLLPANFKRAFTSTTTTVSSLIFPNFSKIKNSFFELSTKGKFIALGLLLTILITPALLLKNKNQSNQNKPLVNKSTETNSNKINPSSENYHTEIKSLYEGNDLIGTIVYKKTPYVITKNKVIALSEADRVTEFSPPSNFGNTKMFTFMEDLNLLFLIDEKNKVVSFSPVSKKFKTPQIQIPDNSNIIAIDSYLTYLYLADTTNNQIYRYPRADGGFGKRTDWLKDSAVQISGTKSMAIDGNIFLLNNDNQLVKLFEKKQKPFSLDSDSDSQLTNIFTNNDLDHIYAVDNLNGEIISFNKNGNRQSYISNQKITQAKNIWVNKDTKEIYFTTSTNLYQIKGF